MARTTVNDLVRKQRELEKMLAKRGIDVQIQMGNSTHNISNRLSLFGPDWTRKESGARDHTTFPIGNSKKQAEEHIETLISFLFFLDRQERGTHDDDGEMLI